MNIYVESNFVIELAWRQEQYDVCEELLQLCKSGKHRLLLPAYCIAEPFEKLIRNQAQRKKLAEQLGLELQQLGRNPDYKTRIGSAGNEITSLLIKSTQEEEKGLEDAIARLLDVAEVIALDGKVLGEAMSYKKDGWFEAQDSFVFASVVAHLENNPQKSFFLTKNSKDFDDSEVRQKLAQLNCRLIFSFLGGLQ